MKEHNKRFAGAAFAVLAAFAIAHADFVTDTIAAGTNPYAVAVNPVTNKTYVANYGSGTVTVIDAANYYATTTITVGSNPRAIAVNALTNKIYVANFTGSSVSVIDGATNTVTATVIVQSFPNTLAINPTTNMIYVANYGSGTVTAINGATNNTNTIQVGTGPSAVCVNPVTNKIYITNSGSNNVTVINGATNDTATVAVGTTPTFVAANTVTNKIYVSNSGSGSVTVIDGATNGTTTITAGTNPGSIAVNLATDMIYTANYGSNDVTVINGATDSIITTVTSGTNPIAVAANATGNKIYIANYGSNNITVIDGETNGTSTLAVGTNPNAVAVNQITNKIFVANYTSNNITVINGATNATTILAAGIFPSAVAVNPVTNKIYANTSSGNILVIDGATNTTATVTPGAFPDDIAVNPVTNKIYVANNGSNNVTVIDGITNATATVAAGTNPYAVAVNPVTNKVYVANANSRNVTVIDGATNSTTTVAADSFPYAVAINPVTNKVYVANYNRSNVTIIDGATNIATTIAVGSRPIAIAINPVTNKIYVANSGSINITVIDGATNQTITISARDPSPGPGLPFDSTLFTVSCNPVTNKIYVGNSHTTQMGFIPPTFFRHFYVMVVDGATNNTIQVRVDTTPRVMAVNPITNNVYVGCNEKYVTVIDGATNKVVNINTAANYPWKFAVNPVTNKVYLANRRDLLVIEDIKASDTKLKVLFGDLPNNSTFLARPSLTAIAVNQLRPGHTGISDVLASLGTAQSVWGNASITNGAGTDSASWTWPWGTDSLLWGENFLCAVAVDSQAASTNNSGQGTPFTGNLGVYPIYRIANLPPSPAAPTLVLPVNNAVDQPTALTFVWNRSIGALSYCLQVAADTGFSMLYVSSTFTSDTLQTVTGFAFSSTYCWRVYAYNSGGSSPPSSVWSFSTIAAVPPAPSTPVLSFPTNNSLGVSINPTLSWNTAARAASYMVQVSTSSDFSSLVISDSGIADTSHIVYGLSTLTLYYWRVKAVNAGGSSPWSLVWNFLTGNTGVLLSTTSLPRVFSITPSSETIRYALPKQCHVSLKYYDLRGRLIASLVNSTQAPGYYSLSVKDALPSYGTYIRIFEAGSFVKRELVAMAGK